MDNSNPNIAQPTMPNTPIPAEPIPTTPAASTGEQPLSTQPAAVVFESPVSQPKSPKKLLIILLLVLVLSAIGAGVYFYFQSQKTTPTPTVSTIPTAQPTSPTPDPTEKWQVFIGNIFSFKYPIGWTVEEKYSDYYKGNIITINNPSSIVSIEVTPKQQPFGFGGDTTRQEIPLALNFIGNNYTANENILNNRTAYVDLQVTHNESEYYILFGTGHPVNDDQKASLEEYSKDKDTILQILSTFAFIVHENSLSCSSKILKLTFTLPNDKWSCDNSFDKMLPQSDGKIEMNSPLFNVTVSGWGIGGPCGDYECEKIPFHKNKDLNFDLITYPSGTRDQIFGVFESGIWVNSEYRGSDGRDLKNLTDNEKQELIKLFDSYQFN